MDVEAVLLDVGGTVFDWRSAVLHALERVEARQRHDIDPDRFGEEWRKQSLIEVDSIAAETAPWRPFDSVIETSLDKTIEILAAGPVAGKDRAVLLRAWENMPVWPEVPQGIARLRQKYFMAPHTILSLRTAAFSSKRAGVIWDAIVSCDALGASKPNPLSYERALAAIGRPADRVCFVAAHLGDLRAAQAHGMKTAYVVARLYDYGDSYEDTGFAQEFDLVADNFTHLAELMGP